MATTDPMALVTDSKWFDYNDLYHCLQVVALWLLYRAAKLRGYA